MSRREIWLTKVDKLSGMMNQVYLLASAAGASGTRECGPTGGYKTVVRERGFLKVIPGSSWTRGVLGTYWEGLDVLCSILGVEISKWGIIIWSSTRASVAPHQQAEPGISVTLLPNMESSLHNTCPVQYAYYYNCQVWIPKFVTKLRW